VNCKALRGPQWSLLKIPEHCEIQVPANPDSKKLFF